MKLDVFGRVVEVARVGSSWKVYYLGNEGTKRLADDIVIPSSITESEVMEYVADLCHEWANPNNNDVTILER